MVELWAGPVSSGLNDFGENKSCFDVYFGDYADAPCVQPGIASVPHLLESFDSDHSRPVYHPPPRRAAQGTLPSLDQPFNFGEQTVCSLALCSRFLRSSRDLGSVGDL
ncbi:hypothetical protein MJO28_017214 [Puccinia striiformis f. sp. tritici]|nr:hypothetical protein MJO28_017214 [Puccinia striiformis f. sp. tritici]